MSNTAFIGSNSGALMPDSQYPVNYADGKYSFSRGHLWNGTNGEQSAHCPWTHMSNTAQVTGVFIDTELTTMPPVEVYTINGCKHEFEVVGPQASDGGLSITTKGGPSFENTSNCLLAAPPYNCAGVPPPLPPSSPPQPPPLPPPLPPASPSPHIRYLVKPYDAMTPCIGIACNVQYGIPAVLELYAHFNVTRYKPFSWTDVYVEGYSYYACLLVRATCRLLITHTTLT